MGPAAIFPFLADTLYISPFVSWGDISYETNAVVPPHVLKSQVRSFVSGEGHRERLLRLLADGMSDPAMILVDGDGWREGTKEMEEKSPVLVSSRETLVLNHQQLIQLGLVEKVLTPEAFKEMEGYNQAISGEDILAEPLSPSALQSELMRWIRYTEEGPNIIGWMAIDDRKGMISQSTWLYIKQALEFYKEKKPSFVILKLNTPGGEVFAAQEICNALQEFDTQTHIPIVCLIDNWAISAGAMIAYSCRFRSY